ncbi:hypothetical protein CEUSTIGMA_g8195.t1 [Chlamydomonas eustigma]|uniref:Uncharacterized protein n=1 Tax=Chlamydomonas eustigma TaxID=1157962 RepID=A0A250XDC4_9CHLO|nr:hypothetical protein CEUSTIGMA_g8195.t1 [Chlamydomonas eustigma]|eukprot:GAX80760.1 hypothetical protein CEUSTIGMA_g8195.t1 [Chlamydomonas eustigma]
MSLRHISIYPNGTCVRYYASRGGQFHRRTVVANAGISGGNGHDNNTTAHNAEQTEIDIAPAITDDVDQLHLQAEAESGSGDDAETSHEDRVNNLNREFFTFLTLSNNGKGINDNDKIRLFTLMTKVAQVSREHNVQSTFRTLQAFNQYTDALVTGSEDGWKVAEIEITREHERRLEDHVIKLNFYYRDMTIFLKEEFGDSQYREHFVLESEQKFVNNERCMCNL